MAISGGKRALPEGTRDFWDFSKVATITALVFFAAVHGCGPIVPKDVNLNVKTDIPKSAETVKDALNSFGESLVKAADRHDPLGIKGQNDKIADLEAKIASMEKGGLPTADQIVTGGWNFEQANAAATGMELTAPGTSTRDSKSILFKFPKPFHKTPEVHICIRMLSAASLQIEVQPLKVSKEGFYLKVHPHGNNSWSDCWLTWIALPTDGIGHAVGELSP